MSTPERLGAFTGLAMSAPAIAAVFYANDRGTAVVTLGVFTVVMVIVSRVKARRTTK